MRTARFVFAVMLAGLIAIPGASQSAQPEQQKKGPAVKISSAAQAMLRLKKLHEVVEKLDLTAEQQEALKKLREDTGPNMKDAFEKLKAVFSDEQQAAGDAAMKEAKEAGKQDRQVMAAVEAAVKMTEEQKKKLDEIGKEMSSLQKDIMKKTLAILSPEQQEKVKKEMAPKPKKEDEKSGKKKAE